MAHTSIHGGAHPVHEELGGYEGSKLAMWLFLATELLFFAVMFTAFAIFHGKYPEAFKAAHNTLDWKQGALNTLFLIVSSLTVALALDSVQRGKKNKASWMLFFTIFLAGCFLVVKYFEYTAKFHHNIFPGSFLTSKGLAFASGDGKMMLKNPITHEYAEASTVLAAMGVQDIASSLNGAKLFFAMYFVMTGVHGLHVVIGMGVLGVILYKNHNGRYSHWYYTPVENGALYWHLVDLIWIYLFPLLYLIK